MEPSPKVVDFQRNGERESILCPNREKRRSCYVPCVVPLMKPCYSVACTVISWFLLRLLARTLAFQAAFSSGGVMRGRDACLLNRIGI